MGRHDRQLSERSITMDRRKLIVGGGAAAVAATLAAVAGRGIPAGASTTDTAPTSTADHARRVLDLVDVELGLVNPNGLRGQCAQSLAASQASFAQREDDPVVTNNLDAWLRQRMVDLCGTDSYDVAVPQTRTLLAFSFLAYSQNQDIPPPQVDPDMPVPTVLQALEPDFLPILLDQINAKSGTSPAFANALQASSAELDQIVAANGQDSPGDGGPELSVAAGVVVAWAFVFGLLAVMLITGRSSWSKSW
jgi:hypothetical protein